MKITICHFLSPNFRTYRGLGGASLLLQALMRSAVGFRDQGLWGKSGPSEELNDYGSCVNAGLGPWHTSRRDSKTHREHVDNICDCILSALCNGQPASVRWRKANRISLEREFVFRSKGDDYARIDEQNAFLEFMSLHGVRVPLSLNSCHRDVKVLCFPQLNIGRDGITLQVEATSATELRVSKGCASRWGVAWLMEVPAPKWRPDRETFAEFLTRGTAFYRSATPTRKDATQAAA